MRAENTKRKDTGLTLVELMVVMAVFTIVVTLSIGAIMQVLSVNQKVRSMSSAVDNVSSVLEIMTIELRYGSDYDCDEADGCDSIAFNDHNDMPVEYFLYDEKIWRSVDGDAPRRLSTPEATIDSLLFHVHNDLLVTVVIKGHVGIGKEGSEFSLQTAVSQRQRHEEY